MYLINRYLTGAYSFIVCCGVIIATMLVGESIKGVLSRVLLTAHEHHCKENREVSMVVGNFCNALNTILTVTVSDSVDTP